MKLTNIRTVSIPSIGKLPLAADPGTFTPSGKKREHKGGRLAQDGGHTESETPAKLELNLNLLNVDGTALNNVEDEDVTIRLADGSVHLMSMAFVEDTVPVGNGEGKVTIISNTSEKIS